MWQGINNITGFKGNKPATVNIAASLPDELNTFYARFEADNTAHTESAHTAAAEEVSPLTLSVADVTWSFKRVNIRKAVGPDGIPGRVLKACAFQLAGVFTDIFNLSLSLSVVPSCFKKSTIVPIPKKNKITCLNDWRPVALTPIFSKKLVREHICSVLPASLDPLQFAHRSNRSTDDAIAFTLHTALSHLENKNTYVRMLIVDYISAFNTIVPATLVAKLQTLGLNRSLCSWILDFLTGRSQVVRMGNNTSSPLILNTGAPQGCVLSPLLYSLYTHDCTATHSSNVFVKFAFWISCKGLMLHAGRPDKRATIVQSGENKSLDNELCSLLWQEESNLPNQIKNLIKSLLLSHHHSTSALVSEILTSVFQTVQKNKTTIYIWTVHIYRLYRRQCAKYTYIYSVYYKDILRYQCTNTHYTPYLHVCIMSTSMHSNMWRCNRL